MRVRINFKVVINRRVRMNNKHEYGAKKGE